MIIDATSKPACAALSSWSNSPLAQWSANLIPQYQIDDEPIRLTTPIPPVRNQSILATPAIGFSTTPNSLQFFLTMNSTVLRSKFYFHGNKDV